MIAVLQNTIGTASTLFPGANTSPPERPATAEDAFLQAFETVSLVAPMPSGAAPDSATKPEQAAHSDDEVDQDTAALPSGQEPLIWPFHPHFIADTPVPSPAFFGVPSQTGVVSKGAAFIATDLPLDQTDLPTGSADPSANLPPKMAAELDNSAVPKIETATVQNRNAPARADKNHFPDSVPNRPDMAADVRSDLPIAASHITNLQSILPTADGATTHSAAIKPATPKLASANEPPDRQVILLPEGPADDSVILPKPGNDQALMGPSSTETPKPKPNETTAETAWRQKWLGPAPDVFAENQPDKPRNLLTPSANKQAQHVAHDPPVQTPVPKKMTIGVLRDDLKTEFAETKGAKIETPQTVLPQPANLFFNSADDQEILPNDSKVLATSLPDQSESTFSLPLPITALSLPSTGAAPQGTAETVTATIVEMVKSGTNAPVELALSPEELGRLTISIRQEGDVVFVNLTADRPETLDLFRRHGGDLVADLRQAGFAGASLSFGQSGQGHPSRFASANPGPNGQQNLPPPPLEATPHLSAQAHQGSGVDLRF